MMELQPLSGFLIYKLQYVAIILFQHTDLSCFPWLSKLAFVVTTIDFSRGFITCLTLHPIMTIDLWENRKDPMMRWTIFY